MAELSPGERDLLAAADRWWAAHADEFARDLADWVAVASVSREDQAAPGAPFGPAVAEIFDVVRGRAEGLGFETFDHSGYAISIRHDAQGRPVGEPTAAEPAGPSAPLGPEAVRFAQPAELGLVSHLDVVEAGEGWTLPPFEATVRDGFVAGRGAADNKGAALTDLYLLRFLRDHGVELAHAVRVVYGGNEEVAMKDLRHFAEHEPIPRLSLITDGPFPVNHAQKGGLDLDITVPAGPVLSGLNVGTHRAEVPPRAEVRLPDVLTAASRPASEVEGPHLERGRFEVATDNGAATAIGHGVGGHSAFPESGILNGIGVLARGLIEANLVEGDDLTAARVLATVLADPYGRALGVARSDDESGPLTYNGGIVRGRPGQLELQLAVRFPVSEDWERLTLDFAAALRPLGAQAVGRLGRPPVHVPRSDPRVQLLQEVFHLVTGIDAPPIAMGGGTHARVLPHSITFGPGLNHSRRDLGLPVRRPRFIPPDHGLTHGPDEVVDLADLRLAFRVWLIALVRLDHHCVGPGPATDLQPTKEPPS
ncbi:MAG: M20/M25/M40 family metallo-hydrolase [Propionibacteriaceae bacterium]|jgi:succinyl-diaminopimelate desuccinylase|nr:M20/M25/M40 family metallo-hydrolase [Propionibacteriaceae bacterium]